MDLLAMTRRTKASKNALAYGNLSAEITLKTCKAFHKQYGLPTGGYSFEVEQTSCVWKIAWRSW